MSSESEAIRIDGLSKCYQVYEHPRDRLRQFMLPRLRRAASLPPKDYFREFWALHDFSLSVRTGETVGIIGRNGSGKSTLLQLICGTLAPTTGTISIQGRVAALLELGAGFNPEFTGRENVHLNAAVLGIGDLEIAAKFDEIAAFADIGAFIDQPVKTYSSGMLVRLAFAVAINVDPAVLIVDEALSVGDFAFQNKCVRKLRQMRDDGVTLFFVSHDLNVVQTVCDRVVWLDQGVTRAVGGPVEVCHEYQVAMLGRDESGESSHEDFISQQDTGLARFTEVSFADFPDGAGARFTLGESMRFRFTIEALAPLENFLFTISVYRADGDWVLGQTSRSEGVVWPALAVGERASGTVLLKPLCLVPGDYVAAFSACSIDFAVTFALTELNYRFTVRADRPTWGRFEHPAVWTTL